MKDFKKAETWQGELSLHMFEEDLTYPTDPHTHDFAEIIYIKSGEALQTINGIPYVAHRGDMFFMAPGSTHIFSARPVFSHYNICFSPETVIKRVIDRENAFDLLSLTALEEFKSETTPVGVLSFEGEERQWIELLLKDMQSEYTSNRSERAAILESYMTILVAKILRKIHQSNEENRPNRHDIWRALSSFIDQNLNQKLSLEDLAQKCFYNPSYFSRAFKRKFGISPVEYISTERARKAAELLTDPLLSMDEIATRCGFGDKSGLYRAFERVYGCAPSEYRKRI